VISAKDRKRSIAFRNLPISVKMALAPLVVLMLLLISAAYSVYLLDRQGRAQETLLIALERQARAEKVVANVNIAHGAVSRLLALTQSGIEQSKLTAYINTMRQNLAEAQGTLADLRKDPSQLATDRQSWEEVSSAAHSIFHHGIRRRGGTIYAAALPSDGRQVQADMRTHLIHRPARDIFPPRGGARFSSSWI
jgi:hypothetical protein